MLELFARILMAIAIAGSSLAIIGLIRDLSKEPEEVDWTIRKEGE